MKIGFFIYHRIDGRGGLENALLKTVKNLEVLGHESSLLFWENTLYPEFLDHFKQVKVAYTSERKIINHSFLPKFINRKMQKKQDYKMMQNFFEQEIAPLNLDALIIIDLPDTLMQFIPILTQYKKRYQIPILTWTHGSIIASTPKQITRTKQFLPLINQHLTVSKGIAEEMKQIYDIDNVSPVQNPIDPAEIIPRGDNHFIYIGRIADPRKQVERLLEALPKLKGEWTLEIFGSAGSIEKDQVFIDKIAELELQDHIVFHGWQNNPWKMITRADLLLLNSYTEGFGLVLAEAMMRGIPCISSDCPVGPREIIQPDINGWLFDVGAESQLIAMLQEIIDKKRLLPEAKTVQATVLHYRSDIVTQDFSQKISTTIEKNRGTH